MKFLFLNGQPDFQILASYIIKRYPGSIKALNDDIVFLNEKIIIKGYDIYDFDVIVIGSTWDHTHHRISTLIKYLETINSIDKKIHLIYFDKPPVKFNKLDINHIFAKLGHPVIPSIYSKKYEDIKQFCDICKYPILSKPLNGYMGNNVKLINSDNDITGQLGSDMAASEGNVHIYQKFIPNDYDIRVLMAFGKIISSGKRSRTDSTKIVNNLAQGGVLGSYELNSEETKLCLSLYQDFHKITGVSFVGIDLVRDKDTNELFVLECNINPGFIKRARFFKMDICAKILDCIIEDINLNN